MIEIVVCFVYIEPAYTMLFSNRPRDVASMYAWSRFNVIGGVV